MVQLNSTLEIESTQNARDEFISLLRFNFENCTKIEVPQGTAIMLQFLKFPEDLIGSKSTFQTYSLVQYALKKTYFNGLEKIGLKLDLF